MPLLLAFAALFVFQLIGEILVRYSGMPLPGPLAGMLLLLIALIWRKNVPTALQQVGNFLIQHLMLLFIPAVTGVMLYFHRIREEWVPFVVSGIVATAITLVVTAVCFRWFLKRLGK